jgi:hypothetical protein
MIFRRFIPFRSARDARYEPEAQRVLAQAYWSVLVILGAIVMSAGVSYGIYEFTRPLQPSESDVVLGAGKAPLNRADLQTVLDGFDMRAQEFEERRAAPLVRDPS